MIRVIAVGDEELAAKLRVFAAMTEADMDGAYQKIGQATSALARRLVPVKTGALRRTIKYKLRRNKVITQAGRGIGGYAPIVHYGQYRSYQAQPFLTNAMAVVDGTVEIIFDAELKKKMAQARV